MKKIYIIMISVVAMMLSIDTFAQVSVGAGYNLGTMTTRVDSERDSESYGGFYLEGTYDLNFLERHWGRLALQPGVRLSYMGESENDEVLGITTKSSFNETYFDIPVMVKYSYDFPNVSLFGYAGPVFSFGMTSTSKLKVKGDNVDYVWKYYNYSGKTVTKGDGATTNSGQGLTDYGSFDTKLGLGLGATFMEKVNVKVGYNIGLLNRYTGDQIEGHKLAYRSGVFYVGLGYNF